MTELNEFITNPEDCESIYVEVLKRGNKDLVAENQRLKQQLDREVKINRKMKRALEKYANEYCWYRYGDDGLKIVYIYASHNGYDTAQQVLKEIDNKE